MGTAIAATESDASGEPGSKIGDLLRRITDDMKTIATNEVELAKLELARTATRIAIDAAGVLFGAIVALIGLGLLSLIAVVVLGPVIPALWMRLLIMAAIYLAAGAAIGLSFIKKLKTKEEPGG